MKAFKIWRKKRAVKTIGYLDSHTAYKDGEEGGWRAALEWAKSQQKMDHAANGYVIYPEIIDAELEEE